MSINHTTRTPKYHAPKQVMKNKNVERATLERAVKNKRQTITNIIIIRDDTNQQVSYLIDVKKKVRKVYFLFLYAYAPAAAKTAIKAATTATALADENSFIFVGVGIGEVVVLIGVNTAS